MPNDVANPELLSSADLWSRGYEFVSANGYRYWYGFFGPFSGEFQ